jgi:hypothetical protein
MMRRKYEKWLIWTSIELIRITPIYPIFSTIFSNHYLGAI